MKKRDLLSRHHSIPTSRGGTDQTIVFLPPKWHEAFHFLFCNMTPDEIHQFLEIVLTPGGRWTKKELFDLIEEIKSLPQERGEIQ